MDDYYCGEEWSEDQWNEYDEDGECTGMIYQPEPDEEPDTNTSQKIKIIKKNERY
jgi:hypothetical protein